MSISTIPENAYVYPRDGMGFCDPKAAAKGLRALASAVERGAVTFNPGSGLWVSMTGMSARTVQLLGVMTDVDIDRRHEDDPEEVEDRMRCFTGRLFGVPVVVATVVSDGVEVKRHVVQARRSSIQNRAYLAPSAA